MTTKTFSICLTERALKELEKWTHYKHMCSQLNPDIDLGDRILVILMLLHTDKISKVPIIRSTDEIEEKDGKINEICKK